MKPDYDALSAQLETLTSAMKDKGTSEKEIQIRMVSWLESRGLSTAQKVKLMRHYVRTRGVSQEQVRECAQKVSEQ